MSEVEMSPKSGDGPPKKGLKQRFKRFGKKEKQLAAANATEADNVPRENTYEPLRLAVRLGWGLPQYAQTAFTFVASIYGNQFYEKMGAGLSFIAFFQSLARSFDVMTDPLMGWVSDNTRSKYGRRRPYMFFGMWGYVIFFVILFSPPYTAQDDPSSRTAYHFGFFYVISFLFDTVCNVPYQALGPELTNDSKERESVFFFGKLYAGLGTLSAATSPFIVNALIQGNEDDPNDLSLTYRIITCFFGVVFILSMTFVGLTVKEREESSDTPAMPLVPSVLRSFKNPAMPPLLIGWVLDAVAVSCLAAMFPFFIAFVIRPDPAVMSVAFTIALCFGALFIAALLSMPMWKWLSSKYGKYRVWMAFNLLNFLTNSLYIFVGEGDPKATIAITALNGIPLGGVFLTDAIVSDVIDYDEFLNGSRNEGGFTVFATFIPKFVSVPAGALPLSLIAMIGFRPSVKGVAQEQPNAVKYFIRFMFVVVPCVSTICSYFAKRFYPIKTEKMVRDLNDGIEMHANGKPAVDPMTGQIVDLMKIRDEQHQHDVWTLDNFTTSELRLYCEREDCFLEGKQGSSGAAAVVRRMRVFLVAGIIFVGVNVVLVVSFFNKLDDPAVSLVPITCVVAAGFGLCFTVVSAFRLKAASSLHSWTDNKEKLALAKEVLDYKTKGQRGGDQDSSTETVVELRNHILLLATYVEMLQEAVLRKDGTVPDPPTLDEIQRRSEAEGEFKSAAESSQVD